MIDFWKKQKKIICVYEKMTKDLCSKYDLTQIELGILLFLHNNPQCNTAADIVKVRRQTKSHVSSAVKALEEKGYLRRTMMDGNKKSILLELTEASKPILKEGFQKQKEYCQIIFNGFNPEEIKLCQEYFLKICDNSETYLREHE